MSIITESQRRRADFLITLLEQPEAKRVAKEFGIKDHKFLERMKDNLLNYASISDAPRKGRDPKYTDEILQDAMDFTLGLEDGACSSKDLVNGLIEEGILQIGTNVESFMEVFVPYLKHKDLELVYGEQRMTFAMNKGHARKRLQWCRKAQDALTLSTLSSFWFTDEILLVHGGDPKGECNKIGSTWQCACACLQYLGRQPDSQG